MEPFICVSPT
jgi:hypothetical protein